MLKRKILMALVFVNLTACGYSEVYKSKDAGNIGFQTTPITTEVLSATEAAVSELENNQSELREIIEAKYQAVRGTNYSLVFMLEDESVWEALVFQDPAGNNFVEYLGPFE